MGARRLIRIFAALAAFSAASAFGTTTEIGPTADFRSAMQNLKAGDTLILDGGEYDLSSYFELDLVGTSALPINIIAKTGQHPIIHYVDTSQNIVNFVNDSFLVIDGIEFSGGSRGLRFMGGSDITVRNCIVHDTAANAIAANDDGYVYARLNFVHNEIYKTGVTGEGFYLGCNNDTCRMHDSLVANNNIHDLNNSDPSYQGDGIEIKKGSYANVVRDNVIHDTHYPGITMYDVNGNGAPNLIERNIIWSTGDNGMQITADAIVRNNIVLSAAADAFASNNIQGGSAANLIIENNTFMTTHGHAIRLNAVSGTVLVANNALYAPNGDAIFASGTLAGITATANAGVGGLGGVTTGFTGGGNIATDFFGATSSGTPPQNLIPKSSLLLGKAALADLPSDDFDGHPSITADIGAYRTNANGTPGWTIAPAFKIVDEIFFGGFDR